PARARPPRRHDPEEMRKRSDCDLLRPVEAARILSTTTITINNDFTEKRMSRSRSKGTPPVADGQPAFLLSQVGAHAAARFAERLEPLGLKPAHSGVLRVVALSDGL